MGASITEQEGGEVARAKGKGEKAAIVVWGFYDEALNGTVHIELLSENHQLQDLVRGKGQMDYVPSPSASKPA